jgi:serine protease Do
VPVRPGNVTNVRAGARSSSRSQGSARGHPRGFYLALPADDALRRRIEILATGATVERPRLGIAIAPAWAARRMRAAVGLPPRDGLLVREVEPDSPAARSGIDIGDLIVAIAGTPISDVDALVEALDRAEGTLTVDLVRGTDERSAEVRFEGDRSTAD